MRDDTRDNAYVYERRVQFGHGDGTHSNGFNDCYQRFASCSKQTEPRPAQLPRASTTRCYAPAPKPNATAARYRPVEGVRRFW